MKQGSMVIIALAALALIVLGALWAGKPTLPKSAPTSRGTITAYEGGRILVEALPGEQTGDKCWFAITKQTKVLLQANGEVSRTEINALMVGQQVSAWASGPVRESYPCQADGGVVVIAR